MRFILALLLVLPISFAMGQVSDDFSDGEFISNPVWSGETSDFEVLDGELKLNAAAAGESYLVTSNTDIANTTWNIKVELDFNPSSQNRAYFYLVADQQDLEGDIEGYYVLIGNTADEISLYRQNNQTSSTELIDGIDATVTTSPNVSIRVTRDGSGNWELFRDLAGGDSYTSEGTAFDDTYTSSVYSGVLCDYSSGNIEGFFFDDLSITVAEADFGVNTIALETSNTLRVTFNQSVDETSAERVGNYSLNFGYSNPVTAARDDSSTDQVLLTFTDDFANNTYTLTLDGISNADLDETISSVDQSVTIETQTAFRDLVINEIYADFNPSAVGLPDEEFLELYNASGQSILIEDFEINGNPISDFTIASGSYVILTDDSNVSLFEPFANVVAVNSFPSLTNGGLELLLHDNLGNLVDSLTYDVTWYQDENKEDGGYTLEQINPDLVCSSSTNWSGSNDTSGGTPGTQNSVYDNSPDSSSPNLVGLIISDENTFLLTFDEPMDQESLSMANYNFSPGLTVDEVSSNNVFSVTVSVTPSLDSGTTYQITVTSALDCSGNELAINTLSVVYDTEAPVLSELQVLTDRDLRLLFDEEVDSGSIIEENFTLEEAIIQTESAELESSNVVLLSFEESFSPEQEYVLEIANLSDLSGNVISENITEAFSYVENLDTVIVVSGYHLELYFLNEFDPLTAIDVNNFGVDRDTGAPISVYADSEIERMLHLIFQYELDDNQTLTLETRNILDTEGQLLSTRNMEFIYDTSSPKLSRIDVLDSKSLRVTFTEKVSKRTAEVLQYYEYEDFFPVYAGLEEGDTTVYLEFNEDFEAETTFTLRIDEVEDLYGNEITTRLSGEFIYDVIPPSVDSVFVKSPREVELWFREPMNEELAEDTVNFSLDGIQPVSSVLDSEFDQTVTLTFGADLAETADQTLTVSNQQDVNGNAIDEVNLEIDYSTFLVSELTVLSKNQLLLESNKLPGESFSLAENYILDQSVASAVQVDEREVTLTFDLDMMEAQDYTLEMSNLMSVSGQQLLNDELGVSFDPKFLSARIVSDHEIDLFFETFFSPFEILDLNLFTLSEEINPVTAIARIDNGFAIRLFFEQNLVAETNYTLKWQSLNNFYGNSIPGHETSVTKDETAPTISNLQVLNEVEILLSFSEPLDDSFAEFLNYYSVGSDIGFPTEASYEEEDSTVLLSFSASFEDQVVYTLTVQGVSDLSLNEMEETQLEFTYQAPYRPSFGELIITEIMSSPTEDQTEFFELYNASDRTIDLTGLSFVDGTRTTFFQSGTVAPANYILAADDASLFPDLDQAELLSWLSLNNGGETLSIYSGDDLIFSTTYSDDWYNTEDDEGLSLEMVDVTNFCGEKHNWTGSQVIGGTPGEVNSQTQGNPDSFGPSILQSVIEGDSLILVTVDEKLFPDNDLMDNISFEPRIGFSDAYLVSPENQKIEISITEALEVGQIYTLTLNQLTDCQRNAFTLNQSEVRVPEPADSLDVILNEILFNPESGGGDFVEIYNFSDQVIDLQDWELGTIKTDGITTKVVSSDHLLILPGAYKVLTEDSDILKTYHPISDESTFVEIASFPSYNDDEGIVVLLNPEGKEIDYFEYNEDYHSSLLDDEEGVSLERVSFEAPSNDPNSWYSAASTSNYATPGLENSQTIASVNLQAKLQIEPKVFIPNGTGQDDFTTINYQLDRPGGFANIYIYDVRGMLVTTLAENQLLSTSGFVIWDGVMDSGRLAPVGYYIVFAEIYDSDGNKTAIKETVVLGSRL